MMKAVSIYETSVSFYVTTRCNIPQDGHLRSLTLPRIEPSMLSKNTTDFIIFLSLEV
jgi:hypothetical protein